MISLVITMISLVITRKSFLATHKVEEPIVDISRDFSVELSMKDKSQLLRFLEIF